MSRGIGFVEFHGPIGMLQRLYRAIFKVAGTRQTLTTRI
jgi:hypothetical protein